MLAVELTAPSSSVTVSSTHGPLRSAVTSITAFDLSQP